MDNNNNENMNTTTKEANNGSGVSDNKEVSNKTVAVKKEDNVIPVAAQRNLTDINLFDEKELALAENFLLKIVRSEKGGIKSINDGFAVLMRAKDLNLPFSTCLEHIHVINGKTGIDIHIIKALLLRAGVSWVTLDNYTPLYEYTDGINTYVDGSLPDYAKKVKSKSEADAKLKEDTSGDYVYVYPVRYYADFNGNVYKDYQLNVSVHKIVTSKKEAIALAKQNAIGVYRIANKPVDFVTAYELKRTLPNGEIMTSIGRFTYSDAVRADMFEKDTYKKYPKVLIGHRAFTYAARDIASDVLFGAMETSELKIVTGKELDDIEILDIEAQEV